MSTPFFLRWRSAILLINRSSVSSTHCMRPMSRRTRSLDVFSVTRRTRPRIISDVSSLMSFVVVPPPPPRLLVLLLLLLLLDDAVFAIPASLSLADAMAEFKLACRRNWEAALLAITPLPPEEDAALSRLLDRTSGSLPLLPAPAPVPVPLLGALAAARSAASIAACSISAATSLSLISTLGSTMIVPWESDMDILMMVCLACTAVS
mmetsp:Transcript_30674/g.51886  ORF Transcript_30674/g.51886 Transcript_30674/m.51886 type:complete len:207 (-) Transcript_30674:372-992(-)